MQQNRIVSRDEWLAARKQHLIKEKEFTRLRDQLSAERRNLPNLAPKGRDEDGLSFTMSWVRHHDSYGNESKQPGDLFEVK